MKPAISPEALRAHARSITLRRQAAKAELQAFLADAQKKTTANPNVVIDMPRTLLQADGLLEDYMARFVSEFGHQTSKLSTDALYQRARNVSAVCFDDLAPTIQVKDAVTDVDGKYALADVPFGAFIVFARLDTPVLSVEWLVPLSIGEPETKLDLFNDNAIYLRNRR